MSETKVKGSSKLEKLHKIQIARQCNQREVIQVLQQEWFGIDFIMIMIYMHEIQRKTKYNKIQKKTWLKERERKRKSGSSKREIETRENVLYQIHQ